MQATCDGRSGLRYATYLMAYFPGPVSATIDTTVIASPRLRAWWFDPRSGEARPIGDLEKTGPKEFTPPAGDDGGDWVLVIDDAAAARRPPGGP